MSTTLVATCDDCPDCKDSANWTECCASCHCAPIEKRCARCQLQAEAASLRAAAATIESRQMGIGRPHWITVMVREDPDAAHALAQWLSYMAASCDSKIRAADLVWDQSDPKHAGEADRFIAKGISGFDHARALAHSIHRATKENCVRLHAHPDQHRCGDGPAGSPGSNPR